MQTGLRTEKGTQAEWGDSVADSVVDSFADGVLQTVLRIQRCGQTVTDNNYVVYGSLAVRRLVSDPSRMRTEQV